MLWEFLKLSSIMNLLLYKLNNSTWEFLFLNTFFSPYLSSLWQHYFSWRIYCTMMALICILLMISDIEHFVLYHLVIWMSSLRNICLNILHIFKLRYLGILLIIEFSQCIYIIMQLVCLICIIEILWISTFFHIYSS